MNMKATDIVNKVELDVTYDSLIELMRAGRQVDFVLPAPENDGEASLYEGINTTCALIGLFSMSQVLILAEKKTDEDGYLTWDTEYWTTVDSKRFIRTYSLNGRVLRDSTTHNIYDLQNDFKPEKAAQIRIS